ncbi:hypothetical protein GCM10023231_32050 [Olivibacter ginsenosidimutans]|uniref:HTH araC/xylS-type domain-containing protein n=1 Tax=Olivibacter ginsenosidimutans TaxID=1176537 RepID=A0ABP9BUV5_9SPHI
MMDHQKIAVSEPISLLVRDIWIFEDTDTNGDTHLPFFADGYPGLLFQQTQNGLFIKPHQKLMPVSFLYGQTIQPITMELEGAYLLIVFRLFPFVFKSFFDVDPKTLNDECYDLETFQGIDIPSFNQELLRLETVALKIDAISEFLATLLKQKREKLDFKIKQVIERIIQTQGKENIRTIAERLHIHVRTLERRFMRETGLSPKQFAKIIQFQGSLEKLTVKDFQQMNEVVYAHGFADQSHFIKVFKTFTHQTPGAFQKGINEKN